MMQEKFLQTNRLYLRQMTENDFNDIAAMMQDPRVVYAWEYTFSDNEVHDWISRNIKLYEKYSLGYFLVCDKVTHKVLGQTALMPDKIDGTEYYEIGYIFKYENWHQGYAYESVDALIKYAFKKLNLKEIIFEIRPENKSSIKVAEKFGAKICGSFDKKVQNKIMKHLIFKIEKDNYSA